MLPNNFWYAVEHSSAVKEDKPVAIKLMNKELVLYRGKQGDLFALDRRCSHRHAALEQGSVEGNCLRCPYHGWLYEADGTCREIPSNKPSMKVPKRSRIKAYPVQEKYGLVWLYWGNGDLKSAPPIPDLSQLTNPKWHSVTGEYLWDSHYTKVIANLIDPIHIGFVHGNSFADPSSAQKGYEIQENEWSVTNITTTLRETKRLPFGLKWLMGNNPPASKYQGTFYLPNIVYSEFIYAQMKLSLFISCIPLSDTQTLTKWVYARNFLRTPLLDPIMSNSVVKVLDEDYEVLSHLPAGSLLDNLSNGVHVHSDIMELTIRKYLKRAIELKSKAIPVLRGR